MDRCGRTFGGLIVWRGSPTRGEGRDRAVRWMSDSVQRPPKPLRALCISDGGRLFRINGSGDSGMSDSPTKPSESSQLRYCRFAIDETPVCLWSYNLDGENKRYLNAIDPDYFEKIAGHLAKDGFVPPDGLARALALRAVYGQGVEAVLALLCAAVQAPDCVPGWMGRYRNEELRGVLTKIRAGRPLYNRFGSEPVTWQSLSEFVHCHVGFGSRERKPEYTAAFAMFWRRLANEHAEEAVADEYNAIKHGLRTRSGGFSLSFGLEETPGVPCPPEKMKSLGSSDFGTSVITPEKIEGTRRHYIFKQRSSNWDPVTLAHRLSLISCTIGNLVGCLRYHAGESPASCNFTWPSDLAAFDQVWAPRPWPINFSSGTVIEAKHIEQLTDEQILSVYDDKADADAAAAT